MSARRVWAIVHKELREYRRNRSIVITMAVIPLVFAITPLVQIFALPESASSALAHGHAILYLLGIPAIVPSVVAAYALVGERQQGSLEPVLTTPIPDTELLLGKALAALIPALAISYVVYALVLGCVALFAAPGVALAILRIPDIVAQVAFTPPIAGWSIWIGIAVSSRSSDGRTAQQLGVLVSVPTAIVTSLIAYDVIHPSVDLAIAAAVLLIVLNGLGWWLTSALFNRERLITGTH